MIFLQEEETRASKSDYYLAQIAAEIRAFRQMFSDKKQEVKLEDFLIKFDSLSDRLQQPKTPKDQTKRNEIIEDPKIRSLSVEDKLTEASRTRKELWAQNFGLKGLG